MDFTKFETISIKKHPELDEKWVQARIADEKVFRWKILIQGQ